MRQVLQVFVRKLLVVGRHRVRSAGAGFRRGTDNRRSYLVLRAPRSHSVQRRPDVPAVRSDAMAGEATVVGDDGFYVIAA